MKAQFQEKASAFDEQKLVEQVAKRGQGWQQAFSRLIAHHRSYLYQRCLTRLGNPADAEDVLQEVMIAAYRYLPGFEGRSSLRTWLTRIADNQCSAYKQKNQRYVQTEHLEALIELHQSVPDMQKAVMEADQVDELMGALPKGAQVILRLRYWADMSVEEIGHNMGLGRSAAKMRAHRALQQCRDLLDTDGRLAA